MNSKGHRCSDTSPLFLLLVIEGPPFRSSILNLILYHKAAVDAHNFGDMVQRAVRIARQQKLAETGQRLVITAGVPFGTPGATNILRIAYV